MIQCLKGWRKELFNFFLKKKLELTKIYKLKIIFLSKKLVKIIEL